MEKFIIYTVRNNVHTYRAGRTGTLPTSHWQSLREVAAVAAVDRVAGHVMHADMPFVFFLHGGKNVRGSNF